MHAYIGTKIIQARSMNRATYNNHRGWKMPIDENGEDEGYLVHYQDNHVSWSPKATFDAAYVTSGKMNFGHALHMMNEGARVRLSYWTTDIYISIHRPSVKSKMTAPYIYVTSRFGNVPWVATQIELLSEKWEVSITT